MLRTKASVGTVKARQQARALSPGLFDERAQVRTSDDVPGSDAIPLHVKWPLTPAGRQHLA
jgi:hypothetical protein